MLASVIKNECIFQRHNTRLQRLIKWTDSLQSSLPMLNCSYYLPNRKFWGAKIKEVTGNGSHLCRFNPKIA